VTTPTGPIVGTASVAITPSTATFVPQLQAGLQRGVDAVSDAADRMGDAIAREITRGVTQAQLALSLLGQGINERLSVTVDVSKNVVGGLLSVGASATKAGAGMGALGLAAGSASLALGGLLATASELSGIAVGLPAVIGSLALVMGTLKVATQGVGEAFSAALSGDLEAITEASKDLAPAARQLVGVMMDLDKRFDALKKTTQQNFFAPIAGEFRGFMTQGTALAENALPRISTELGKIAGEFLNVARTGTFFGGLRELVDQTVSGLQRWKGVTGELANALGNLFKVGAGFSGDMIAGIGGLIQRFSEWVNAATASGELQARLQGALDAFATLGRIIGNVADIFGAFWFAGQESGANFLGVLEQITGQLATFLNSDAGIASLTALMTAGATAAAILGDVIGRILPVLGQFVTIMSITLVGALEIIAPALRTLITAFEQFSLNAMGGISQAIIMLARGFTSIIEAITPLLPVLGEIVGMLATHFAATLNIVMSIIGDFLKVLEPFLPQLRDLIDMGLTMFTDALTAVADAIMPLMPVIIELATKVLSALITAFSAVLKAVEPFLPVLVELATKILTLVAEHFINVFEAIEPLIPVVIELVTKGLEVLAAIMPVVTDSFKQFLPLVIDLVKEIGGALAPVLPAVVDAFKNIFKALEPVLPQLAKLTGDLLVTGAKLFTALVEAVLPLVPPLIQIGTEILSVLIPAFNDILQAILPVLPVLSELAVQLLREALLPILQAILPILPQITDAFIELLPSIVMILPPLVQLVVAITPIIVLFADLANLILQVLMPAIEVLIIIVATRFALAFIALGATIDALRITVQTAWDAIVTAIQVAWLIIKGIFDIIISLLQGDFSEAWRRLQRLVGDVWEEIKGFVSRALDRILGFITDWGPKVWNAVWNALSAIAGVFSDKAAEFVKSIQNAIVEIIKWFTGLPGMIKLAFSQAWDWLYQAGKDIVQGLLNGMMSVAKTIGNWVNDNIVAPIKNAIDGVKGFFTGSPSRWMTQRGKWISEGLAIGIEDAASVAVRATTNLVDDVKTPIQTSLSGNLPDISRMLGSSTVASPGITAGSLMQTASVVFGQGAVVVSFEGVVPSEADALRTGQAVGRGIVDVIAERDAKLAVRVL
jgi:phage-related protein